MLNEKETKRMTKDEQSSDEEKTGVMSCGLRVAGTRLKFTAETQRTQRLQKGITTVAPLLTMSTSIAVPRVLLFNAFISNMVFFALSASLR